MAAASRWEPARPPGEIDYPDHTKEYFGYNNAGELAWHRRQDGTVVTIARRDALHRVTETDYPVIGSIGGFSVAASFDEFGRVTSTADNSGTTTAAYDVLNRITTLTPPSAQKALTYSYAPDTANQRWTTTVNVAGVGNYIYQGDGKGRLSALINPFNRTFTLGYDPDGKNTLVGFPDGVQEQRMYTPRDWLSMLQIGPPTGTLVDTFQYLYYNAQSLYDPTGHLQQEVDAGNRTHAFSYDHLYQLTGESHPDFGSYAYVYDANGNRTQKTSSLGTDYYGIDANNKLLWVNRGTNAAPTSMQSSPYTLFGYDLNGNMISRERRYDGGMLRSLGFLWDGDNRLRQVNEGATNRITDSYDGDGTRVSKTENWTGAALTHQYSWGPDGLVYDSNAGTVYTPGLGQRVNGVEQYLHRDWLGSTRYISDVTGYPSALRFDAFGNRSATGGTGPYDPTDFQFGAGVGYQSEFASTTEPGAGLQYLQERYYDPAVGRFISQDPVGYEGGLSLYGYTDNDPVNSVDPSGRFISVADGAVLLTDVYFLSNSVREHDLTGTFLNGGIAIADAVLTPIPGAPPAAGELRLATVLAGEGGRALLGTAARFGIGQLLRGVYNAQRATGEGCGGGRSRGNGGRGGGPDHAAKVDELEETYPGGAPEVSFGEAHRAADYVEPGENGGIHQVGDMRTRGGLRPSAREPAAIEDIRKEVGPNRDIIFHDKLSAQPSLRNPDLQPGWKPAPARLRNNP